MKFWDASAIVPLLMTEPTTKAVQTLAEKDPDDARVVGGRTGMRICDCSARAGRCT
jgi:hypothetical protein